MEGISMTPEIGVQVAVGIKGCVCGWGEWVGSEQNKQTEGRRKFPTWTSLKTNGA